MNIEITTEDYRIYFDEDQKIVYFRGFLRLEGMKEYQPIMDTLLKILTEYPSIVINLEALEFLNSSGISMLSMFVMKVRGQEGKTLTFKGSKNILWQTKSLRNLQRLMPNLTLEFI
jgi:anti-anti-sigma factor